MVSAVATTPVAMFVAVTFALRDGCPAGIHDRAGNRALLHLGDADHGARGDQQRGRDAIAFCETYRVFSLLFYNLYHLARSKATRARERYFFESASQIALMVSSWLKPRGFAGLFVFAKYQLSLRAVGAESGRWSASVRPASRGSRSGRAPSASSMHIAAIRSDTVPADGRTT